MTFKKIIRDNSQKNNKTILNNQKNIITDTYQNPIHKTAKGTIIVLFGTMISSILLLIIRIIFARFFESSEYGIFSLCV